MKRVMIYAYTNFNLGDDLFIKVLCERYPNTRFVLHAPSEYEMNFKELNNITLYRSDSIFSRVVNFILRSFNFNMTIRKLIARQCDAIVNIGGSIFMQQKNWKKRIKNREKVQDKPFFLLGANFGPYSDEEYYISYKELFKKYTDICFRDKYSYDLFKDLGNVRMADDVIFQLGKGKILTQRENNIIISVIKPSVRKHLANFDNIYYEKIKDITIYCIEKGYKVTLMSFCENEGDEEAIEAIEDLIPKPYLNKVIKHSYKFNIEQTLNIIAKSSFVVGTRFHAMILGWVYNKPVFPIAYSRKMINVMKDINFTGVYSDFDNIHKLDAEQVFNSIKTNSIDVSDQILRAEKHFKILDEYLLN